MQQGHGMDMSQLDLTNPYVRQMMTKSMIGYFESGAASLRPTEYENIVTERMQIRMPDGVRLSAFLASPDDKNAYPVILTRNPYMSNGFVYEACLQVMAKYGYSCVLVEVRGTQTSEGEWQPFVNEMDDGKAVLDWIAAQEWCNGSIGCFGGSYLGHVQWAVPNSHHPALKTLFIQVYGPAPYDNFWRRGMFRQEIWTIWATQMMGDNRFKAALPPGEARKGMHVRPQVQLGEQMIGERADWFNEWAHSSMPDDPLWTEGFWHRFAKTAEETSVPVFLAGGWNDIFIGQQMNAWRRLLNSIREKSRFLIGPWNHGGMRSGVIPCPDSQDDVMFIRNGIEWFDYMLKGLPYAHALGAVETYRIGAGRYDVFRDDLKAPSERTLYFAQDGALSDAPGAGGSSTYLYDPENSPENHYGNILGDGSVQDYGGPCWLRDPGSRSDEISFLSDVLEEDLDITGAIRAELYVSSDAPATAFSVTLCEVFADGRAVNIRNDITDIRWQSDTHFEDYQPMQRVKLSMKTADVTWRVQKGSRLRVDVSSSNYPAYHLHPNTTQCWAEAVRSVKAQQTVYYGDGQASCVTIPASA